ncbi:MAG: hypothetical protein EYC62_08795 [Alphaproteobacteria bacterium]|nr:MAG: hypothetical protein EYC62_08795 [Alphaproteobacteria bacterium]
MADLDFAQILDTVARATHGFRSDYTPKDPMANLLFVNRPRAYETVSDIVRRELGVEIASTDFGAMETVGRLATAIAMTLDPDQAVPQIVQTVIRVNTQNPAQVMPLDAELTRDRMRPERTMSPDGRLSAIFACEEYFGLEGQDPSVASIRTGDNLVAYIREGLLANAGR